ncbi:MAG: histidine kinase dimerization/phospho-acceptor domain-containing protein [Hylemonella sp.]|nr:histidine kinase dimerization/phospho-acceptor domain-containing protein [Hylemonella sp.]
MDPRDNVHSWFGASLLDERLEAPKEQQEFRRLWLGFMTARVMLGLVLLLLQVTLYALGQAPNIWLALLCGSYFAATLMVRVAPRPRRLGQSFDQPWLSSIGVDVLVFTVLHLLPGSSINYAPLYALPVLQAAVLGSLTLAMGTAAGVTLLLLLHSTWQALRGAGDATPFFIQAALTGAGSFVIAFLAHQLSARLASEQQRARRSQHAMRIQQQVNDLVIEALTDGILVVDVRGTVHAANPAARHMLQADARPIRHTPFSLAGEPGWQALSELAFQVFTGRGDFHHADIGIEHLGQGNRRLRVRTRMTTAHWGESEILCVMFLQDLREMEARMRTEKLAAMGRMSAAVAHEIRNPLAAIAQANALLEEDIQEPRHIRLTQMIRQNAKRLDRIVDDVLNVSRAGHQAAAFDPHTLELNQAVLRICRDWAQQTQSSPMLGLHLARTPMPVNFDPEHLHRVLVNLLDNARRYASRQADAIQVHTQLQASGQVQLAVWSDGPPMDPSVEQHLFEPFFSSESRSSGLGLYICRELCEGHGATIGYQRARRIARDTLMDGNEFFMSPRRALAADGPAPVLSSTASP